MNRSRLFGLALVLAALAGPAPTVYAQSPIPGGVELSPGQWVPCSHQLAIDAGRGCVSGSPGVPPSSAPPAPPAECAGRLNPYDDADQGRTAARCAAWFAEHQPAPPRSLPVFVSGATYRHPYGGRIVVLTVARSLEGVPVVLAQWTTGADAGGVLTFRSTELDAGLWERVP